MGLPVVTASLLMLPVLAMARGALALLGSGLVQHEVDPSTRPHVGPGLGVRLIDDAYQVFVVVPQVEV